MAVDERARHQDAEKTIAELRARIEELEDRLVEQAARSNAAVAAAQERSYWLDRWHLDLNALMRRPAAGRLRGGLRALRAVLRAYKRARRALRGDPV